MSAEATPLPEQADSGNASPASPYGSTSSLVPRLDKPLDHGVASNSLGAILASQIIDLDQRANTCFLHGKEERGRGYRTLVAGMLHSYNLMICPIIHSEAELWQEDDYVYALENVRKDLDQHIAFWEAIGQRKIPALERYRRLTKMQQERPDAPGIAKLRAEALHEEYQTNGWSYRQLATEVGLSTGRVQQLLDQAQKRSL